MFRSEELLINISFRTDFNHTLSSEVAIPLYFKPTTMRARTLLDLISLSTNVYMISKNEELMNTLKELADKGKDKFHEWSNDLGSDPSESQFIQNVLSKAMEAKTELEHKMEEVAAAVYEKMRIAHANDLKQLKEQVAQLSKELQLAEARLVTLETQKR